MDKRLFIENSLKESSEVKLKIFNECMDDLLSAVGIIVEKLRAGGKLIFIGNGGSAADCQHLATEFMIRLNHNLNRPAIPAIALTTDSSNLTAGGNDIGYENVFARNVEGLGKTEDVLIAISTSGNSTNILKAIEKAKTIGMTVIGFSGKTGGKMSGVCNLTLKIPSDNVQRIQEGHITIGHIITELVELELYAN